jgi:hypothetical protein
MEQIERERWRRVSTRSLKGSGPARKGRRTNSALCSAAVRACPLQPVHDFQSPAWVGSFAI